MLSERQEIILNNLIREYIDSAEPISSDLLKKKLGLDISPATIRNELQELTEQGYVKQPHTSAGRVPTKKGYTYFVEITFTQEPDVTGLISREMEIAKKKIDQELALARELMDSLMEKSMTLNYTRLEEKDKTVEILELLGPSSAKHQQNLDMMRELLKKLGNF